MGDPGWGEEGADMTGMWALASACVVLQISGADVPSTLGTQTVPLQGDGGLAEASSHAGPSQKQDAAVG